MRDTTHYDVLGVPRTAGPEEIRRAFRHQARRHHPDMNDGAASTRYLAVAEAYQVLSDPAEKAAYDATLRRPASSQKTGRSSAPSGRSSRVFTTGARPERDPEPVWPHPDEPVPAPAGRTHVTGPAPARWWFPVLGLALAIGAVWMAGEVLQVLSVALGAVLIGLFLSRRGRQEPAVPVHEARSTRSWGEPGTGCVAGSEPLRGSAQVCRNTARVIAAELGDIPGLRTFHGVDIPGAGVVDHVLVCGDKVAVVASRETTTGALGWWRGQISGGTSTPPPVDLDTVRQATGALGAVIVSAWVLVYGPGTSVSNRGAPPYVRLQTVGRGMVEIRNWLLADNDGRLVDRVLLQRVSELLTPGETAG